MSRSRYKVANPEQPHFIHLNRKKRSLNP